MKAIKKITFILFLLSSFWGYSQNNQPTKAQDWNSSRSNKTHKTSSIANPGGNDDDENINNQNTSRTANPNQGNPPSTNAQDWNSSRSNKTSNTSRVSNYNNSNPLKGKDISNSINIGIAYGLSVPSSSFKGKTYAGNGSYFELSGAYYFSKIGLGISIGQISNPTDNNLSDFTGNLGFSVSNNSENIKSNYIGIGPQYKLKLNKFETIFQIRAGMYTIKSFAIGGDYIQNADVTIPFFSLNSEKTTTLGFVSTSIKFDYYINHKISLFASAGYLTALSDQLLITESNIVDLNNNGIIDQEDFKTANGKIRYSTTEKNSTPSSLNLGFGISYHFGLSAKKHEESQIKRKRQPGRVKYDNITLSRRDDGNNNIQIEKNKVKEVIKKKEAVKNSINPQNPQVNGETPPSTQAQDWNSSRSNKTSKTSSITNPNGDTPPSTQAQDWNSSRSNKTSKTSSISNDDNTQNNRKKGYDYYQSRSNNTQNQIAKKNCIQSGGVFWENADGSYSCKTTITKSQKSIKISNQLSKELAAAKKMALADKTQQGIIEIIAVYPNKNKTTIISIPPQKTQDAETILQQLIEATQGNGEPKGKIKVKYVATL